MKKIISCFIAIVLICIVGFSIYKKNNPQSEIEKRLNNSNVYPYYQSLSTEDKEIYVNICTAIETFDYAMDFGKFDTYKEAREMKNKAVEIYSALIYEQPQYFWIDPYGCRYSIVEEKGNKFTFYATGILSPKEAKEKKEIFDKKISEIVSAAKTKTDIYSQVLYVYDEILDNTSYDYELSKEINKSNQNIFTAYLSDDEPQHTTDIKQTAYGCLIDGKTVCSGYSLAFNLIMQELGYECGAVKNTSLSTSLSFLGNAHVSNYCKLDNEYYYFDLTWDDTGFDSEYYKKYFDYSYENFAITKQEFTKRHLIEENVYAPDGQSLKYDYYVKNKMYFEKYDFESVKESILSQSSKNYVVLKFGDYSETLKSQTELLENRKILSLIGEKELTYVIPEFSTFLYIFF